MLPILRNRLIKADITSKVINYFRSLHSLSTKAPITNIPIIKANSNPLNNNCYYATVRWKSKSTKQKQEQTQSEEESEKFEDEMVDKSTKIIKVRVNSLRVDALLKSGLGIARNKIEVLFYESKIRVNGEKMLKKSAQVEVGDEIDVIRGVSPNNPKFLIIGRVEVLNATGEEDYISVKIRRCKSLTVENYKESWKA